MSDHHHDRPRHRHQRTRYRQRRRNRPSPPEREFDEGTLEWKQPSEVPDLDIPQTDREVMWPLVQKHREGGFFTVHIDWADSGITWKVHESQ